MFPSRKLVRFATDLHYTHSHTGESHSYQIHHTHHQMIVTIRMQLTIKITIWMQLSITITIWMQLITIMGV